jgi:hypothetical protein
MTNRIPLIRVISGGQTGADQGGLQAAYELSIPTGGWTIKNYGTEVGPMPELAKYGLHCLDTNNYVARTALNAQQGHLTIWFGSMDSRGFQATRRECQLAHKPFEVMTNKARSIIETRIFLYYRNCKDPEFILNVAGNRESSSPGIHQEVYQSLLAVLSSLVLLRDQGWDTIK